MKAISVKQPWAWLIVNGYKDMENRNWKTKYRGDLLIHAAKAFDYEGYFIVQKKFPYIPMPDPEAFLLGGVVGKVTIEDVVTKSNSSWFTGPYGFWLINPMILPFKPWRGRQSLFSIDLYGTGR